MLAGVKGNFLPHDDHAHKSMGVKNRIFTSPAPNACGTEFVRKFNLCTMVDISIFSGHTFFYHQFGLVVLAIYSSGSDARYQLEVRNDKYCHTAK